MAWASITGEIQTAPPYGGKLVNLGKLSQMGINVPTTLYDLAVDKTAEQMASNLNNGAYIWVRRGTKIAVRSCGASEDGNLASFAGQYETVLNVPLFKFDASCSAVLSTARSYRVVGTLIPICESLPRLTNLPPYGGQSESPQLCSP